MKSQIFQIPRCVHCWICYYGLDLDEYLIFIFLKKLTMYTPQYLKYLQFSKDFFQQDRHGFFYYLQKCHMMRCVDHHALHEITRCSSPSLEDDLCDADF